MFHVKKCEYSIKNDCQLHLYRIKYFHKNVRIEGKYLIEARKTFQASDSDIHKLPGRATRGKIFPTDVIKLSKTQSNSLTPNLEIKGQGQFAPLKKDLKGE